MSGNKKAAGALLMAAGAGYSVFLTWAAWSLSDSWGWGSGRVTIGEHLRGFVRAFRDFHWTIWLLFALAVIAFVAGLALLLAGDAKNRDV